MWTASPQEFLITLNISLTKTFKRYFNASGVDPKDYQDELQDESRGSGSVIEQYCTDMTARAEEGKQDPVVGREEEMYRLMQVLSRRTKNNPCLIGEPGVGKTGYCRGTCTADRHRNGTGYCEG